MDTSLRLRLGARGSALARWQADWVAARLTQLGVEIERVSIATQGDVRSAPIGEIGGVGVFTKEIQRALLEKEIDLAVHSLKDLPTDDVKGLTLAAVPERESPGDALICSQASDVSSLPLKARVGTGSMRRRAQLLHARADLQIAEIRGNLDTRLRKLDEGHYDALVLAEAGLKRLGWRRRIVQVIPKSLMLPAVGQGALGVEARSDDAGTLKMLAVLDDPATRSGVTAERTMLAALRSGCLAPVGAWGRVERDELRLDAVVLSVDGQQRISASCKDSPERAEAVGAAVAQQLLAAGAGELIAASRNRHSP